VLKEVVGSKGVLVVNPRGGMKMRLGLMSLDVVWPSRDVILEGVPIQSGRLIGSSGKDSIASLQAGGQALQNDSINGVLGKYDYPGDLNDLSVVFTLKYGEFDALLTGDIGPKVIDEIVASGRVGDVEYLKVPHHGSKNGLTQELLNAVTPEIAVISAGEKNRYGHPHREVVEMLRQAGIDVYRSDEEGDVEVVSDGESFWIQ
jgi:beta-lactamase superfamily II metal-dependent hydrolase